MSNKRINELKKLSKDELVAKERELRKGLFEGKMKATTGQLENSSSLWTMRKDLARVKSLQTVTPTAKAKQ